MTRLYHYVGPSYIKARADRPAGMRIRSAAGLLAWVHDPGRPPRPDGLVAATLVIDEKGELLLARHTLGVGSLDLASP
jgi:hypothetical protein